MPTHEAILDALRAIIDPDFQQDIVSLGFVQDLAIRDGEGELARLNRKARATMEAVVG